MTSSVSHCPLAGAIPGPVSFYDVSLCRCDLPRTDKMSILEITNYSVTLNGELAIATWCEMRNDKVVRIVIEISLLLPCRLCVVRWNAIANRRW